ncbi:hypothetical protein [Jeotgalibacillus proteolyticus]|uniref:hypothetical protein n=1 Tax=Jeotgalibacillus proteolyticus TaxID=2082395 RepID=UPI00142FE299|nr:hypothetical protein [Jeotgalibacillus proteolyticus]
MDGKKLVAGLIGLLVVTIILIFILVSNFTPSGMDTEAQGVGFISNVINSEFI